MNKEQNHFLSNLLRGATKRAKSVLSGKHKKAGLNWFRIKKLKHLPYNSPNTYSFLGGTLYFNNGPELLHSLEEIFVEDIYKIPFKTSTPNIIDCGANIGLSVLYLKKAHPGARVIAFEPDPVNYSLLQKNMDSFDLGQVELRNEAIWKEDTTLEFVSDGTLGSSISASGNNKQTVRVKATRLRDLLDKQVDFLKMDIEGAEYEVLMDCADQLQNVDHLFIEFHGFFDKIHELTDILKLVQDNGFAYYIKEASNVYPTPFYRAGTERAYDIQQNIFCFKNIPE